MEARARARAGSGSRVQGAGSTHPRLEYLGGDAGDRVRIALRTLTRADREILRLAYGDGVRPHEIAKRLDEPVESIRDRKSRAVARLRQAYRGPAAAHGFD